MLRRVLTRVRAIRARRRVLAIVVPLIILAVLGAFAWVLSRASPSWWADSNLADPRVQILGEQLEHRILTLATQVRPGVDASSDYRSAPWTLSIREDEACAWLATRFPMWVEHQFGSAAWPKAFTPPRVAFRAHGVHLAVRELPRSRIIGGTRRPFIDSQGQLWIGPGGASLGRLPLPQAWILDRSLPREARAGRIPLGRALRDEAPLLAEPVIPLDQSRRVRILSVGYSDGVMTLTCRTEAR